MLSDRLSGIQANNQANLATARARAVQRGLGTPNTAPRPQARSEYAPQQRTSGSRSSNSPSMRSTTDARSIAELGQVSQQITNRIHAARQQGASPQSYAPATAPRPSPLPARTNPYYQKYGQDNYSEQLHNVDHAIEDTLEQLDVIAYRLNARLERRPSIDELQQRGVIRSTAGAPQLSATALALERWPTGAKSGLRLHPPLRVSRCCNSSAHPPSRTPPTGQLVADSLNSSLARRPSLSEVQQAGIIKGAPGVAPRLIEASQALQRRRLSADLDASLAMRPGTPPAPTLPNHPPPHTARYCPAPLPGPHAPLRTPGVPRARLRSSSPPHPPLLSWARLR